MKPNNIYGDLTIIAASLAESGPVCTQILGLLGANIIHIERPSNAPMNRVVGFVVRNSNKKIISLDTKTEEGKNLMWTMLEKADVFFENFAPGAWDRMGFSYEEVKKRNPEIVYVSLKGFARGSRFQHCITYDPVACCSGGGTFLSGLEDGDPLLCGINVGDSGSAIVAASLIAGAILRKKVTGKGCFLETPMQNAVVAESRQSFAEYYARDGKVRRAGNTYRGLKPTAPWNIYPCQGQDVTGNYVAITCSADENSKEFESLCKVMGREDLLADPKYATPALRYENRYALDAEISKWTIKHRKPEIMQKLAIEARVPCGIVNGPADICRDPFTGGGEHIMRWMEEPLAKDSAGKDLGGSWTPTIPLVMPESGDLKPVSGGMAGHGNEEVFCGWLGLSKEELADLKARHIV
ncbi:MAG: CoA transferase [Oscillospiraceae bacterium]|nr:CoA transferase [Oscillospiraceae bacterium]